MADPERRSGFGRRSEDLCVYRLEQVEREVTELALDLEKRYITADRMKSDYIPRKEIDSRFLSKDKLANQYVSKADLTLASDKRARILNVILALALVVEPVILAMVSNGTN